MVHAADQHLTCLGNLEDMTKRDTKDTHELAGALRDSVREFSLQLNRNEAALLDTQVAIQKQVRYSAAIREIEMTVLEMKLGLT